jgi:hypothetical protein
MATIKQSYDHWSKKLKLKNTAEAENSDGKIIEYSDFIEFDIEHGKSEKVYHKFYKCACPGFDNTARKSKNYVILKDSTPELFKHWVEEKIKLFTPYSEEENLFFINAWNEWAEGNYMEPNRKWGRAYLEAVKDIFK